MRLVFGCSVGVYVLRIRVRKCVCCLCVCKMIGCLPSRVKPNPVGWWTKVCLYVWVWVSVSSVDVVSVVYEEVQSTQYVEVQGVYLFSPFKVYLGRNII